MSYILAEPTLTGIPMELILIVAAFLDLEQDISALARTSLRLYHVTIAYLYQRNAQSNIATALFHCARTGNELGIRLLLKWNPNVNIREQRTVFDCCMSDPDSCFIEFSSGLYFFLLGTPLRFAIRKENATIAQLLLQHGADEEPSFFHETFSRFVVQGHVPMARVLLEAGKVGPNYNAYEWHKRSTNLLFWPVVKNCLAMVQLLIEYGAYVATPNLDPIHAVGRIWVPPLHLAIQPDCEHVLMVELLIANGADVNYQNGNGTTPLHHASAFGNHTEMRILLTNGADPNIKNCEGYTSLHYAVLKRRIDGVRILLEHGADANMIGGSARTKFWYPLDFAKKKKDKSIVKLLRENGAQD